MWIPRYGTAVSILFAALGTVGYVTYQVSLTDMLLSFVAALLIAILTMMMHPKCLFYIRRRRSYRS